MDSWPEDIDDTRARRDWGYQAAYDLERTFNEYLLPNIRVATNVLEIAMYGAVKTRFEGELEEIREAGLWKGERVIEGPQGARLTAGGARCCNFCANNYLGLANDPTLVRAAQEGLTRWGLGLASVRFICGTQSIHKDLEAAIARFLGMEDAILYTSCFDANGGLFETLLAEGDAVISDALNHASIIDGIRLCRAERHRYEHGDMSDLERILEQTRGARTRLIATDGVFSMDGDVAPARRDLRAWRIATTRSSWWTTAMRPASSARRDAARRSIAASPDASTSSRPRSARRSAARAAASRPRGARS